MPFLIPLERLPIWMNWRRRRYLRRVRDDLDDYFRSVRYEAFPFRVVEDEHATAAREALESELVRCRRIVHATGKARMVRLAPGEHEGEVVRVNVIAEAFHLHHYNLRKEDLFEVLETARAAYRADRVSAWLRTVNPLYWLDMGLGMLELVPFLPLRLLGLRWREAARSFPGRVLRLVLRVAALVVLVVGGLKVTGLEPSALDAAQRLYHAAVQVPWRFLGP